MPNMLRIKESTPQLHLFILNHHQNKILNLISLQKPEHVSQEYQKYEKF